jgi:class 3 adenylate cyclase
MRAPDLASRRPVSETRFVRLHDGREVAFRCVSDAPGTTIVFAPGGTTPIEVIEDDAMSARFLRTLGRYGSLVALDRLGIGASDAFDPDRDLFDQLADSFVAVLDAIDADTAWLVVGPVPGPCLLARVMTRHRSRLAGGALLNPSRMGSDAFVAGPATLRTVLDRAPSADDDPLRIISPSRADDPAFQAYHERAGRLGASAAAAAAYYEALGRAADLCYESPGAVGEPKPVLVAHRRDNRAVPLEDVEWWHQHFPGSELVSLDGADLSFEGLDAALLADTIGSFVTGARVDAADDRPLRALLFVDLVASTERASSAGDARWRGHLDRFELLVGSTVDRHGGTTVKHTGDGALATFSTASRALSAAVALRSSTLALDLEERIGIHVGEIEIRGDDVGGIAVHLAARVMSHAQPGQILVSSAVAQTTIGGAHPLKSVGTFELKGIDRAWELFELTTDPS